ncbi:MAG: winged helix-turn-helix domain-containing protein [Actinomycetota bacterium]|nr:winged helix-turn-helix domain-containing protein [Actinomycetota bacterium]
MPSAPVQAGREAAEVPTILESGSLRMDVERHTVTLSGALVALALKEFEVLELLLRDAGRVVPRVVLLDRVWAGETSATAKALDATVRRLRDRIEPDPLVPARLVTVRGLGYRLDPLV